MPSLEYVVGLDHPDLDCCAYLLSYVVVNEACWHFAQGVLAAFIENVQPTSSYWDVIFF